MAYVTGNERGGEVPSLGKRWSLCGAACSLIARRSLARRQGAGHEKGRPRRRGQASEVGNLGRRGSQQ